MSVILEYEIAHTVADRMDQSQVGFTLIFTAFVNEIKCQLRKGNTIQIAGLGDFVPDLNRGTAEFYIDSIFKDELSEIPQQPDKN